MNDHGSRYCVFVPGMFDHPVIAPRKPFDNFAAWQWLVFEAAWKPRRYGAGSAVIQLERGQLAHSTRYMAKAWGWPETNVRRFLERLKTGAGTGAMIGAETGAGLTVITICNYDRYQLGGQETGAPDGAEDGAPDGAKVAQGRRRKEESKTDKQESITRSGKGDGSKSSRPKSRSSEAEGFADWYAIYPKKVDRLDAEKAYRQTITRGEISPDDLVARTQAFASQWSKRPKDDFKYCKAPAAWLRAGSYDDDGLKTMTSAIPTPSRPRPEDLTDQQWRSALSVWRTHSQWSRELWGPQPNEPGCLVPAEILFPTGGPPNGASH